MSQNDILMYRELLELLEKRFDNGEIDKTSYSELKQRYTEKLEKVREDIEFQKDAPDIKVSGEKSFTESAVSVSGSATFTGGKIMRDIRISGAGKIAGDVECNALRCAGAVKAMGNITAHGEIKCSGSFKCDKDVYGNENATFTGSARISGEIVVQGKLTSSGSYNSYKNTQARNGASITGSSVIGGNLISRNSIKIGGKSRIEGNILCESILIEGRRTVFESWFFRRQKKLVHVKKNIVAQNEVDVQDTHVYKNVKGRIVKLGPNTFIEGTVYYVEDLFISDSAKLMKEPIKITQEQLKL